MLLGYYLYNDVPKGAPGAIERFGSVLAVP